MKCQEQAHELKIVHQTVWFSLLFSLKLDHPTVFSPPASISFSLSLALLYQGSTTPWEAQICSAHPEELMTSNVPVNAEKAEHPS